MVTERIESLISKEALDSFDQLNAKIGIGVTGLEKLIAKGVEINRALGGAKTFKQFVDSSKELEVAEKALVKQNDELIKQQARLDALRTEEAKKLAELRLQQQELNKANKQAAQETLGLVDAYKRLELEYAAAAKEAKNLSVELGANSKEAKEASARALELDARLKQADASTGKFNRDVGNYSGALKTLESGLNTIKRRIDDYTKSGNQNADVLQSLRNEESLLEKLLQNQISGFTSATAEIKANTKALQELESAGLKGTAAYNELFAATADLKDETADLKKALTNAAPDDVAFNAAADAARGLIGVYGLAKSAAAVFGIENEALEETLVKLQAAETALQSIEAIRAVFKKENAVRQAINIGLQKVEVLQTNLQSGAESRNIVIKYAAVAAQKALNLVTSAAGGPILAIIGLLALLGTSLLATAANTSKTKKETAELNEVFLEQLRLQKEINDLTQTDIGTSIQGLKNKLELAKAYGKTQGEILALELTLLKTSQELSSSDFFRTGGFGKLGELRSQLELARTAYEDFILRNTEANNKDFQVNKDLLKSKLDLIKEQYAEQKKVVEDYVNNNNAVNIKQAQIEKLNADEQRKYILESTKIREQAIIDSNERILSNDSYTYTTAERLLELRLQVLKNIKNAQIGIANAELSNIQNDPSISNKQKLLAQEQNAQSIIKIDQDTFIKRRNLQKDFDNRQRKAQLEILKLQLEDQIKAQELISNNDEKSYSARLSALYAAYENRRRIIVADEFAQLENTALTESERIAIVQKALSDINQLTIQYSQQQLIIAKVSQENINKEIEASFERRKNIISKSEAEEVLRLNEQLRSGTLSIDRYNKQRSDIEKKYRIEALQAEVANAFAKVYATKEGTAERLAAEAELAEKTKALSDDVTQKQIQDQEKLAELKNKLAQEAFETFTTLITAQYDREKNAIQDQIDALDKKKEKDIEIANNQAGTEQEKADRITIINVRAQAQKEALERRQRQIDLERARFEKAANIVKIIAETAYAVVKALGQGGPPYAAIVGAIGAAQLARAIATPLPKFAQGTDDAPGGHAIVGDGGKKELVVTPDGKLIETPATPTVMNIPKHSIVFPDARKILESGIAMSTRNPVPKFVDYGSYYKEMTATLGSKIDRLNNTIKNKKELHITPKRNGWEVISKSGNNRSEYLNNNLQ
jgi:hypothetical protein